MITNIMPAEIIYQLLMDEGVFDSSYPIYIGHMPSGKTRTSVPAASITDTVGTLDGRLYDGTVIEHPGLQLRVRHRDPATARSKIVDAVKVLDTVKRKSVTIGADSYRVDNVSRQSTVIPLGTQEDQMQHFTVNMMVTINKE